MAKGAWAEGMTALDREAGRVGLAAQSGAATQSTTATQPGTATASGSVWPVIGFGFLVVALIADRIRSYPAVPVRWLVVLLILGIVVVAGQLRAGGRVRALDALPPVVSSLNLLTFLALLLAAQQLDFLNLGVTQVAWFAALVCIAVPLIREARRQQAVPAAPPTALRQSAPLLGAVLVVLAIVVGWLPGQDG
ncbi:MAG: hypothetical protein JO079_00500, partial [Frankiaceae bacterium]|nr:hypothetical protein [Frankiaceae bacterium]